MDDRHNPYRPPETDAAVLPSLRPPKPTSLWIMQGLYAVTAVARIVTLVTSGAIVAVAPVNGTVSVLAAAIVVGIQLRQRWAPWTGSALIALFLVLESADSIITFARSDYGPEAFGELLGLLILVGLALLLVHRVTLGDAARRYFSWTG